MSVYFVWVCDARKEYIDPYPLNEWHLFDWMYLGEWQGCSVRLLTDSANQDEYYGRTSDDDECGFKAIDVWGYEPYTNVTAKAKDWWNRIKR